MKKLIILFLISFAFIPTAFSVPNYDPNHKPCIYDDSYNVELYNRLRKEYFQKCVKEVSPDYHENVCGVNSYYYMVQNPYNLQKKPSEELSCK